MGTNRQIQSASPATIDSFLPWPLIFCIKNGIAIVNPIPIAPAASEVIIAPSPLPGKQLIKVTKNAKEPV